MALSILLCEGNGGKTKFFRTVDINPQKDPDIVGDIRTIHGQFLDNSLNKIIFQYCPKHLFADHALDKWFGKIRRGGEIIIRGIALDDCINHNMSIRMLLKKYINIKNRKFKIMSNGNVIHITRVK